jgi:hypothetical protein
MRTLFVKLLVLAAPFLVLLAAFQVQYSRQRPNAFAAKKFLLERQLQRVEVLVLGPSYSDDGVLPGLLGRPAFNLAMPSQSLYYDRALLNKYLGRMPSLKTVLLPVSYVTLETELDSGAEPWRCYYYHYEYGLPHRVWSMAWHPRNFLAFCLDDRSPVATLLGRGKDFIADYDPWGSFTNRQDRSPMSLDSECNSRLRDSAVTMLKCQKKDMRAVYLAENEQILLDMIHELQRRGISPILLSLPVHRYYAEERDAGVCRQETAAVARIRTQTGVAYFDFTCDSRFSDGDFREASHLNLPGAEKFSQILRHEVLEPHPRSTPSAIGKGKGGSSPLRHT